MESLYKRSEWFRGVWFGSAVTISGTLLGIGLMIIFGVW